MKTNAYFILLATLLIICSCTKQKTENKNTITFSPPISFNPPTYVCYKAPAEITIDGILSPEEWDMIPWTTEFVDIEGDKRPQPHYKTQAKMAYTHEGLYIAAKLEEPNVWATITEHDAVIFQNNNFEFFLNPTNDTHNYLEYEINALGTDWDLYLNKPYRDPGCVVLNDWEFMGMKSAVYIDGTLNDPSDKDNFWSVEIFLPWQSVYQVVRGKDKPSSGDQIRVNFSRVEWPLENQNGEYVKVPMPGEEKVREYNWVWAPTGVIDIHRPEYWGFVHFSDLIAGTGEEKFLKDPEEEFKWILRNLYYRQREYREVTGQYASEISELMPQEVCPETLIPQLALQTTPHMYQLSLSTPTGRIWNIREDGLIWYTR